MNAPIQYHCYIQRIECFNGSMDTKMFEAHIVSLGSGGVVSFSFRGTYDYTRLLRYLMLEHGIEPGGFTVLPSVIEAESTWFNASYKDALA